MELKEIRKEQSLSQRDFAEKYHINVRTLQRWEQGETKVPPTIEYMLSKLVEYEKKACKRK